MSFSDWLTVTLHLINHTNSIHYTFRPDKKIAVRIQTCNCRTTQRCQNILFSWRDNYLFFKENYSEGSYILTRLNKLVPVFVVYIGLLFEGTRLIIMIFTSVHHIHKLQYTYQRHILDDLSSSGASVICHFRSQQLASTFIQLAGYD